MDSFAALKRRTTDLLHSLPQALPSMPARKPAPHAQAVVRATWERIDVPPLPRSSHSVDIVAGTAYIFGGENQPRQPVDNDMHAITLPFSSAGADYYPIRAKAGPREPAPAAPPLPTITEPAAEQQQEAPQEKGLDDVPLTSPTGAVAAGAPEPEAEAGAAAKGKEPARPGPSSLGDVPAARVGHATAVIGYRIFMFGGRGGPDMQPLDESGRVWVFDTRTRTWSYLDPLPPARPASGAPASSPVTRPRYPAARSYHAAVATDRPRHPDDIKPARRGESWAEWAQGDSDVVGTPQRPIVGNIAAEATDEDSDGYGTLIVHGGCLAEGRAADVWAFDVRSRVWQELPPAPGPARGGAAIAIARSRLYRFGGFNGEAEEGGQLDCLDLVVDTFDDASGRGEVCVGARGGWRSLAREDEAGAAAGGEGEGAGGGDDAAPLNNEHPPAWPGRRSVAGLEAVAGGGGREYLVLLLGERAPSGAGHEAAGQFWGDAWAFQVPLQGAHGGGTAASVADRVRGVLGGAGRSGEGRWFRVEAEAYDDEDEDAAAGGPGPRGWVATAPMGELEERGVVVWGGVDGGNRRLGDGWILRLGAEKREA